MEECPIKANRPGLTLVAGLSAASGALPLDSKGKPPVAVRVITLPGLAVHLRVGDANVTATTADFLLTCHSPALLDTSGMTHISAIQAGINLGGAVNIYAYE